MKKFFLVLIVAIVFALGTNANAATISIVSIHSVTSNSVTVDLRIQNLTLAAFYQVAYGVGINYNTFSTNPVVIQPTLDDTVSVVITGLSSGTLYSCQGKILGATSASSAVVTFTTDQCSFSPAPTIYPSGTISACANTTLTAYPSGALYQWKKNGANISGATSQTCPVTTSGSYTCEVAYSGCTMTTASATNVNISGAIGLQALFTDSTICQGSTIRLRTSVSNSTNVSYSWSPVTGLDNPNSAEPLATPSAFITYVLTADNNDCSESVSVTVFPVNPPVTSYAELLPNGFILNGNYPGTISSVLVNGEIIFPKAGYNTTTYAVFDYPGGISYGDLIIINTVSSECSEMWHFAFLGISFAELEKNGNVYPNPSTDKFFVNLNTDKKCIAVVYNSFGQIVSEVELLGGSFYVEDLSSGFYTLKVLQDGNPIYLAKLIKQ